ncbi:hypothetical protein RCL1_008225 [Eukaryota sp. TZLM3-RCL]
MSLKQQLKLLELYAPRIGTEVPLNLPKPTSSDPQFVPLSARLSSRRNSVRRQTPVLLDTLPFSSHDISTSSFPIIPHLDFSSTFIESPQLPTHVPHNSPRSCCRQSVEKVFSELSHQFSEILNSQTNKLNFKATNSARLFLRALNDLEKKFIDQHEKLVDHYSARSTVTQKIPNFTTKYLSKSARNYSPKVSQPLVHPTPPPTSNPTYKRTKGFKTVGVNTVNEVQSNSPIKKRLEKDIRPLSCPVIPRIFEPDSAHKSNQTDLFCRNDNDTQTETLEDQSNFKKLFEPFISVLDSALAVQEVLTVDFACTLCMAVTPNFKSKDFEIFVMNCGHSVCFSCLAYHVKHNITMIQCGQCGLLNSPDQCVRSFAISNACSRIFGLADIGLLKRIISDLKNEEELDYSEVYSKMKRNRPLSCPGNRV